jgi:hypothetical protein
MCERLRPSRRADTTLAAGIGVTAVREADDYVMTEPSWNSFSKQEAETSRVQASRGDPVNSAPQWERAPRRWTGQRDHGPNRPTRRPFCDAARHVFVRVLPGRPWRRRR